MSKKFVSKAAAVVLSAVMMLDSGVTAAAAEEIISDETVEIEGSVEETENDNEEIVEAASIDSMVQSSTSTETIISSEELEQDIFSDDYAYLEDELLREIDASISEEEAGIDSLDPSQQELIAETYAEVLSGETVFYDDASDIARLVQMGYSKVQHDGPISITHGTLTTTGLFGASEEKEVYLICLSGTDTDAENQTTGWWTDLLVGFERDNRYIQNVRKAVIENVPEGANLIIAGHSLGGMVAQQAASDSVIKDKYNVLNTVTFGSPLINGFSREGTVKRLGDKVDPVPYLSVSTIYNIIWQAAGLNRENGGYGTKIIKAHCESYQRECVWGAYDVTGTKYGGAALTLYLSTIHFYKSPVTVTE